MYILALAVQLALLTHLAFAHEPDAWTKNGWEQIKESEGIRVFRKNFPNTDLKGVGGEALIDSSIGKILGVLMDHQHKSEWVDRFQSAKNLESTGPLQFIQYTAFNLPFPVANRDFVISCKFTVDSGVNALLVDIESVEHPDAPESKSVGVRGKIQLGRYWLYPKGENHTFVKIEYLTDPRGLLPSWLINLLQKNWPYKTLAGLRRQLKKEHVSEWQPYLTELKPKLNFQLQ